MITALTALLVLISLGLVVPVALATPGEWESSKVTLYTFQLAGLVVIIAAFDGISSAI
jgi:photosystem II core protein PsbZ